MIDVILTHILRLSQTAVYRRHSCHTKCSLERPASWCRMTSRGHLLFSTFGTPVHTAKKKLSQNLQEKRFSLTHTTLSIILINIHYWVGYSRVNSQDNFGRCRLRAGQTGQLPMSLHKIFFKRFYTNNLLCNYVVA